MQLISKAGTAWLAQHDVPLSRVRLASRRVGRYGAYVSFAPDPRRPKQPGFYKNILLDREGRWLLRTEVGAGFYREHRNGHAVLMLPGVSFPEVAITALHGSATPLEKLVSLPSGSVVLAGEPTVIRADVKRGATSLLLRVEREPLPEQERWTAKASAHSI